MQHGLGLSGEVEAFRREVCEWFAQQLTPDRTAPHAKPADRTGLDEAFEREMQREAGRRGWLGISLPVELGGGGRSASFAAVFGYEAAYHDAPVVDTAITLAGAPIVAFGTRAQQADLLPRMLAGEIEMCIAYTEPAAGNDLAALSSVAQPSNGGYLLTGRKTLITGADKADICLTIARTNPDVPARRGSSLFLVDMRLPGVSVAPQRTMAGYDLWDVIFDDVRLGPEALLGTQDGGWRQLAYAVEHERTGMFSLGWCQRLFDEILAFARTPIAGMRPIDDPVIASGLAQQWADLQTGRLSALALVAEEMSGERSGSTASAAKVVLTELAQRLARFGTEIGGPAATAAGSLFGSNDLAASRPGRFGYEYLFRFDGSVSVGANELHKIAIAAGELGVRAPRDGLAEVSGPYPNPSPLPGDSVLGYDADRWDVLRRELWPVLGEPEALCLALEGLGRQALHAPVQSGLVQVHAALNVLHSAGEAQLLRLQTGERFAMGIHDAAGRPSLDTSLLRAVRGADGDLWLSGTVHHVTYGDSAQTLLVPVMTPDHGSVLATIPCDAAGIARNTRETIAHDRLTDFTFADVRLAAEWIVAGEAEEASSAALSVGVMALCAESVGMAAALVEITAARVRSRQAFGAPLAALPTVQLRMGEMYLDLTAARAVTAELAANIRDTAGHLPRMLAATKLTVTAAAGRIVAAAHQLCGGWGQLEESGLHVYTRGLKAAEWQLGGPAFHRERLGRMLAG